MKCTQQHCHHPALVLCDSCGDERCVNHSKMCEDCGKTHCHSFDALCYSAHECGPTILAIDPKKAVQSIDAFTESVLRELDKIARVN